MMALETEIETYRTHLQELLPHEGKFVLIHGLEVIGVYGTYEDALKIGYEKFGLNPFMVKRIQATEQAQFVSRNIFADCRT
jgi:hypothetical protein